MGREGEKEREREKGEGEDWENWWERSRLCMCGGAFAVWLW
jgi:hypothetical protein